MSSPRLAYSLNEVAQKLGLGLANVKRLIDSGELESRRVGRRVIVPVSALELYLGH